MRLLIRDWTNGDWVEVIDAEDGTVIHRGHSVPDFVWIELLQNAGVHVVEEDVEGEDE